MISYNVHSCVGSDDHYSVHRVARVLAKHHPCIVCLQEVEANTEFQQTRVWSGRHSSHQPNEIATRLELPHVRFAPAITSVASSRYDESHNVQGASGEFGIAILSKHPILSTKHHSYLPYGKKTLRNALACLVELPRSCAHHGAKLWIVNTHLGCHWGGEQFQQARELVQFIDSLETVDNLVGIILCGDFNSLPYFRSVKTITEAAGMTDTFQQGGVGSGGTFPAEDKILGLPWCCCVPSLRLDYIFVKGRSDCVELIYSIVLRGEQGDDHDHAIASDHFPLCAVFVVKLPSQTE